MIIHCMERRGGGFPYMGIKYFIKYFFFKIIYAACIIISCTNYNRYSTFFIKCTVIICGACMIIL